MLTKEDLQAIKSLISDAVIRGNNSLEKKLRRAIKKESRVVINYFDREYLGLKKRVERAEDHLGLPPII